MTVGHWSGYAALLPRLHACRRLQDLPLLQKANAYPLSAWFFCNDGALVTLLEGTYRIFGCKVNVHDVPDCLRLETTTADFGSWRPAVEATALMDGWFKERTHERMDG